MENVHDMCVTKRDGSLEELSFDKILNRIKILGHEKDIQLNSTALAIKVIEQLYDKIETTKIDELAGEQCESLSSLHPDYSILASRIIVSNNHKNTCSQFSEVVEKLYHIKNIHGKESPIVSDSLWNFVKHFSSEINQMIVHERDYLIDYFGLKTLEKAYLFRIDNKIVERPQYMWMRVAIGIHGNNSDENSLSLIKETYDLMSQKYFTHATPTLFNSGTPRPQMSSCFLVGMQDDSIEGIFSTLQDCAMISKWAGGIGLHIHNIRAKGSCIYGTNGSSNGIVPMLRVFNNTAKYVDQGGNKRKGSFAIYLEPWHGDIEDFLDMKKNHGDEESKGRDLFYALWVCDLFMERVFKNEKWSLFCPNSCPGLSDVYGEDFVKLYEQYECDGKAMKTVSAQELWYKILDAQMETGTPYLLYKDAANTKSNQKNIGVIKSSNLCCEIMEFSGSNDTAVCNLASIGLPIFVDKETKQFDYEKLHYVTKVVTNNLNVVIDINFYPTEKSSKNNKSYRPIGIGVQGLADMFVLMDVAFYSLEAIEINKKIFETMYHAALEKSNELALETKKTYKRFINSPASKGILQFDMWGVTPSERYDWSTLKKNIQEHGLMNSLLIAPMPTATTSQILGFNECFEPFTSNLYSRRTLAGEFVVVNKYLMKELIALGEWNVKIKSNIIANKGSIQQLTHLPLHIRNKYKIVWEIPMKHLIDMAADRGAYVCQSQSMNLWMENPTYKSLTSMHFYSWKKGLKTGIYYLRTKSKHQAQQFTIEPDKKHSNRLDEEEDDDDEPCKMCSA
jgi:ribonucleoside-diphosphate reductase alpha subunit